MRCMEYRLSIEYDPLQILLLLCLIVVQSDPLGQDISEASIRLSLQQMTALTGLAPPEGHFEWLVFPFLLLKTQF